VTGAAARAGQSLEGAVAVQPVRLWTHQETAEFLSISQATLHDLNYKRTGPRSFKVGRHRRYDQADVMSWLSRRASDCPQA
jgi:predicted DNA-binding transcriptional regulator AlpA